MAGHHSKDMVRHSRATEHRECEEWMYGEGRKLTGSRPPQQGYGQQPPYNGYQSSPPPQQYGYQQVSL